MTKKNFKTVKDAVEWLNKDFSKKMEIISKKKELKGFLSLVEDGGFDYIKNNIEVEGKEMYLSNIKEYGDTGRNQYIVFLDRKNIGKFEVIEVVGLFSKSITGDKEEYNYFDGPSKQLVNTIRYYSESIEELGIFTSLENYLKEYSSEYDEFGTVYVEYLIMQEVKEHQETDEQIN